MRHGKSGKKLGRKSAHRKSLWSNMVTSLLEHEKIRTTDVKAKELRRMVEPAIAWATSVGDVLAKPEDSRNADEKVRILHAMRMAARVVRGRDVLKKLFGELGTRFAGRHGGYVRITKLGNRPGDFAPMSMVELV